MKCEECNGELEIGDWPYCNGDPQDHVRQGQLGNAFFEPIVVFKDAQGNVRVPGHSGAKPPKGFEKVEINNRRDAARMARQMGETESRKFWEQAEREHHFFNGSLSRNRAEMEKIYASVTDPKVRAFMDHAMREGDKRDKVSYTPGVYFGVLE